MEPVTLTLLTSGVMFALKRWRDARKARELPDPPVFTPAQIHSFTRLVKGSRVFDRDMADALMPVLEARGADLLRPADLGLPANFGAQIYRVVLPRENIPRAADVVRAAHTSGATVLGSLSLRMICAGVPDAMLILTGPADLAEMAAPTMKAPDGTIHQGFYALFPAPPAPAAEAPAPPVEQPPAEAAPPPASASNGAPPNGSAPIDTSGWTRIDPPPEARG